MKPSVRYDGDGSFTVEVPTEFGNIAVVDVTYDAIRDTYSVAFSGQLLRQSPESVTVVVQLAMRAVQDWMP